MSGAERLLDAAVARLARGDGQGPLINLGIQAAQALRDAEVSRGVLYNDELRMRGGGSPVDGLLSDVMDHLLDEQLKLREDAIASYSTHARSIADGAGRETIASALLAELRRYGAVPGDADDTTRARERAYYLAIALCDAATSRTGGPIASDKNPAPELRFRRHLLELHGRHRPALVDVYREFLEAAGREPVHDVDRLERVVATFIEGVLVVRRIVACHEHITPSPDSPSGDDLALGDDELVDAVLRLFMAMSKPIGGDAPDPDAVLFRRDPRLPPRTAAEATLHLDAESLHGALLAQIDDLGEGDELSHCSLHASAAAPARTEGAEDLKDAIARFAARGGRLRSIEKIGDAEELEATVAALAGRIEAGHDVRYRALVVDGPPAHSPMLIGDHVTYLARAEHGLIVDAVSFGDEAGRRWCRSHFDALWDDDRAYTLATPEGLNHHGIKGARLQLEALARQRQIGDDA